MAVRNIVKIDEEKCTGCGLCVTACAEGAIQIIDGKARLVSDSYCDGLGACLGHCPEDAITIEQREAPEFDEVAVKAYLQHESGPAGGLPATAPQTKEAVGEVPSFVCPGLAAQQFEPRGDVAAESSSDVSSQLTHWPVQLKLVSPTAQCFADADLLLTADCVPLAVADFHGQFLKGRAVAVGCPKLDDASLYVEKFADILGANNVRSLTVVHMEVPCCSGLVRVAREAILGSGKAMNYEDVTISIRGEILARETIVMEGRSEATTVDHA